MCPIFYIDCVRSQALFMDQDSYYGMRISPKNGPDIESEDEEDYDPYNHVDLDNGERELIKNQKQD